MVCSTAAQSGMKIIKARSFQTSLQFMCCQVLRKIIPCHMDVFEVLQIPPGLRDFLHNNLSWLLKPGELAAIVEVEECQEEPSAEGTEVQKPIPYPAADSDGDENEDTEDEESEQDDTLSDFSQPVRYDQVARSLDQVSESGGVEPVLPPCGGVVPGPSRCDHSLAIDGSINPDERKISVIEQTVTNDSDQSTYTYVAFNRNSRVFSADRTATTMTNAASTETGIQDTHSKEVEDSKASESTSEVKPGSDSDGKHLDMSKDSDKHERAEKRTVEFDMSAAESTSREEPKIKRRRLED